MLDDIIPIRLEIKNKMVRDGIKNILHSLQGFEVRNGNNPAPVEVLIYEVGSDLENEFQTVQSLLNQHSVNEVFLTSENSDPAVLVQALRTGAREFFPQPIQEQDIVQALERYKERRARSKEPRNLKSGKLINVIGSKGGVGTTTVAVNLAANLAREKGKSVALVDMNLLFGEIPLFLNIEPSYHWGEIAKNISRLDASLLMGILHEHASGVHVLPSPRHIKGHFAASPEIIRQLLNLMKTVFDYIVVDGGQSIDDVSMKILEMSDRVLLISILSLPCLANVKRLLRLFSDLGYPNEDKVQVIVNRYLKNSEVSLSAAEESIEKKIFWTIPNDFKTTVSSINQGKVLAEVAAKAPVTKNIKDLAATFSENGESPKKGGSLLNWKFLSRQ